MPLFRRRATVVKAERVQMAMRGAEIGDWFVWDELGRLSVCKSEDFALMYAPEDSADVPSKRRETLTAYVQCLGKLGALRMKQEAGAREALQPDVDRLLDEIDDHWEQLTDDERVQAASYAWIAFEGRRYV